MIFITKSAIPSSSGQNTNMKNKELEKRIEELEYLQEQEKEIHRYNVGIALIVVFMWLVLTLNFLIK